MDTQINVCHFQFCSTFRNKSLAVKTCSFWQVENINRFLCQFSCLWLDNMTVGVCLDKVRGFSDPEHPEKNNNIPLVLPVADIVLIIYSE